MNYTTKKNLVTLVCVILGAAALVGLFSFIGKKTNGWQDDVTIENLMKKKVNPDNLYTVDSLVIPERVNTGYGLVIETDEQGVIILDGSLPENLDEGVASQFAEGLTLGSVTLTAGTYTLTTDAATGMNKVYLYLTDANDSVTHIFDFGGTNYDGTVEIATDGTYYLKGAVALGAEFDGFKLYPTIVKGDEAGEFYAK